MFWMLALGSRGDVQPMALLARRLVDDGHEATVVALDEYRGLAAALAPGARFAGLDASLDDALVRGPLADRLGRTMAGQFVLLRRWTSTLARPLAAAVVPAVQPGDVVVTGALGRGAAMALVAGTGCRMATLAFTGQVPTTRPESFFAPQYLTGWQPWDRWGTRLSWELGTALGSDLTRAVAGRLGLPRTTPARLTRLADDHPVVVAASPLLVPPAGDWPASTVQTGYVAPPVPDVVAGGELASFLARRPAYAGFGSFTRFTDEQDTAALVRAAELTGCPLVTLARPGTPPGMLSPDVLAVAEAPFEWLFGQVAATVHHGGSGTAHEALRSGRPTAVVPFGADQPYHAARLHALGLGPAPGRLAGQHLDATMVARLLDGLLDGPHSAAYARRAAEVAGAERARDGLGRTAAVLERLAN